MKFDVLCSVPVEAVSYVEAVSRLAPFLDNPRNPNLLPAEVQQLKLTSTYNVPTPAVITIDRTYCTVSHCNDLLVSDSDTYCESHLCRPGEESQLIWAPWRANYGWDGSKNLDGKEPDRLRTYAETSHYVKTNQTGYAFSTRKYIV